MTLRRLSAGFFILALGTVATMAQQQGSQPQPAASPPQQGAAKPANIDRNGVLMLVRSALLALDQANKTGNYTVLRDLGAPGFQAVNTAAKLSEIFAQQRNDKLDLSGVAVIDPQLTILPQIENSGLMHMAGFFPSVPSQVNFELLFAPVEGQWRLFGLSVNVGQSAPVAPSPPPAGKPQAATSKKSPRRRARSRPRGALSPAAAASLESISSRSNEKSIGLVSSPVAPPSSDLRLVSASP